MGGCISSTTNFHNHSVPITTGPTTEGHDPMATPVSEGDVFFPRDDHSEAKDLPHISEREDLDEVETLVKEEVIQGKSPTKRASIAGSSSGSPNGSVASRRRSLTPAANGADGLRRSNSTGTLFVDATVTVPNHEDTLRCVALAIHYTVVTGHEEEEPEYYKHKFDEKLFPLTDTRVPDTYADKVPSEETIYRLINRTFHAAALTAECAIIALVYINRIIQYTGLTMHASNWKRVLLAAILMASKVWDDQAVWNVDFCSIYPKIKVEDLNDLERTVLEMLQFNINVDSSVYAKYYFELRSLAEDADRPFPLEPMSTEKAAKLEATSQGLKERMMRSTSLRATKSMDHKEFSARAVMPH